MGSGRTGLRGFYPLRSVPPRTRAIERPSWTRALNHRVSHVESDITEEIANAFLDL